MKLTEQDILSIAQSGEGYNAEFKVSVPSKVRELAGEVCAFANAAGGTILLGVDDTNEIKGIEISNSKRSAIQDVLNQLNPHLYCPFYFVRVHGKEIGVIDVPSGLKKPYTLSGAIYIRQGANSQKITSVEQMRDFFQASGRIYFDEGSCKEFSLDKDLDTEFFKEFRAVAGFSAHVENQQIIRNLKLRDAENSFKNGSVLFFGKEPEKFFDTAVIRCVAFEGTDKVQIFDDKVFGGALMNQYRGAMQWLKQKLNIKYIIEGGGPRKEQWEIPESVFKESLINALSHRDYYDRGGKIMVELFDDRVEITNPGGLVSAIKPEEFGFKSHSRNPLIFGLFNRIDMVEQVGSGIGRIKKDLEKLGQANPIYKTDGLFTVVFKRNSKDEELGVKLGVKTSGKMSEGVMELFRELDLEWSERWSEKWSEKWSELSKREKQIIIVILNNSKTSRAELSKRIGINPSAIQKQINKLKEKKIIQHIGSDRGGYWEVIEEE